MGKRIIATIISCITVFMMFGCGGGEKYPPDMGFKITDITKKTEIPEKLAWDKYIVDEYTWEGKADRELYDDFEYYYNVEMPWKNTKYYFVEADENAETYIEVYNEEIVIDDFFSDENDNEDELYPCIRQTIKLGDGNGAFECGAVTVEMLSRRLDEKADGNKASDYEFKCKKSRNGCHIELYINGQYAAVCEIASENGSVKKYEAASFLFDKRKILDYDYGYNREYDSSEVFPDNMPFTIGSPTDESMKKFYQYGNILGSLWTARHGGKCIGKCEYPIGPGFMEYYRSHISEEYGSSYLSLFCDNDELYCHRIIDVFMTDIDPAPFYGHITRILNAKEIFPNIEKTMYADVIYYPCDASLAANREINFNITKSRLQYPAATYFYAEGVIDDKVVFRMHVNTSSGYELTKYELANYIYNNYKVLTPQAA